MLAIFAIGAALTNTFGRMVGNERQGWAILAAMLVLFVVGVAVAYWAEAQANPALAALGVDPAAGNMEGKEVRFGIALSALFATITTAASCGAVNAMHDSFMPLGGMIPLINMQLGEVIVGGVGAGLYGMLLFAILAVFIAGLMVGRTPEYLGKKIEAREVKMAMLAILCLPLMMLGLTAIAVVLPEAKASIQDAGPHGFSEVLYAFTSAAANNGSAFAGLTGNTPFYNLTLALAMFVGRFFVIVPMLAIAGALGRKDDAARLARHLPDRRAAVRRPPRRRRADRRRAHLLPGAGAGSRRRAPGDDRRADVLREARIMNDGLAPAHPDPTGSHRSRPAPRSSIAPSSADALIEAVRKLHPRRLARNPVMFVVAIVATLSTVLFIRDVATGGANLGFSAQIIAWLWITVLFANFAEAVAEGRGKAQAASLRKTRTEAAAKLLADAAGEAWREVSALTSSPATSCWSRPATSSPATAR